jgi:hypothetical protein
MSTTLPTADTNPAPTTTPAASAPAPGERRLSVKRFARHFAEMVAAMVVGMVALDPLWTWVLDAAGASWLMHNPYTGALIMATNMTVAMSAWMKIRGHAWRPITEMSAAMYLPFLVLFAPLGLGLISSGAVMLWGHLLMLPAMAAAMLLRPDEYAHC